MAEKDAQDLDAVRRFARKFSSYYKLTPPVDVEALLADKADIEYAQLPGAWEAIAVSRAGARAKIFIDPRANKPRLRFTLGHELGHIAIPWQFGIALCNVSEAAESGANAIRFSLSEVEANRFASEVLLPRYWLERCIPVEGDDPVEAICSIASAAEVSVTACSLALGELYVVPTATWITDAGKAEYVQQSPDCPLPKGHPWWIDEQQLRAIGGNVTSRSIGSGRVLHAVTFDRSFRASHPPAIAKTELLAQILSELPTHEATVVARQLNGIIGYANNSAKACTSIGQLEQFLRGRFVGRRDAVGQVAAHPLFSDFVAAVAHELFEGRGKEK